VGLSTDDEVPSGARYGSPGVISRISPKALAPFSKGGGPVSPTSNQSPREKPAFKPASILSSGTFIGVDVPSVTLKPSTGAPRSAATSAEAELLVLPGAPGLAAKETVPMPSRIGDVDGNVTLPTVGVALCAAVAAAGVPVADGEAEQEVAKEASGEPPAGLEPKRSFARMLSNRLGFGRKRVGPYQMSIYVVWHGALHGKLWPGVLVCNTIHSCLEVFH
jgi:hypothetical protein